MVGCSISTSIGSRSSTIRRPRGRRHGARGGGPSDHGHHSRSRRARPARWRRVTMLRRRPAWSRRSARCRSRSASPAARAPFAVAGRGSNVSASSASLRISMRPRRRGLALARGRRPIPRQAGGRNRIGCSTSSCASRSNGDWAMSRSCGMRSARRHPRVVPARGGAEHPGGSSARRRWPAGLHAERRHARRLEVSSRSPKRPASCSGSTDRIVTGVVEAPGRARARRCRSAFSDLVHVSSGQLTRGASQRTTRALLSVVGCIPARSGSISPRPRSFPT